VGVLVVLLVVLAVAAAIWWSYARKRKRQQALATFASQYALQLSPEDVLDMTSYPFRLFSEGDGRGCENVMTGSWQGLPVTEADYWYYTQSNDSHGRSSRSYHYFSVIVAGLECDVPEISIQRERVLSRLADHLGFHDIEFESEDFNRRFQVTSRDREFAFQLVDDRMMRWLLSTDGSVGFETYGPNLLAWTKRLNPSELPVLFGSAKAFVEHVPRLVWTEYGTKGRASSLPRVDQGGEQS
jgi:hypothetical protein